MNMYINYYNIMSYQMSEVVAFFVRLLTSNIFFVHVCRSLSRYAGDI
jgi:hypothetical protein